VVHRLLFVKIDSAVGAGRQAVRQLQHMQGIKGALKVSD
jgi:hypothetical protein